MCARKQNWMHEELKRNPSLRGLWENAWIWMHCMLMNLNDFLLKLAGKTFITTKEISPRCYHAACTINIVPTTGTTTCFGGGRPRHERSAPWCGVTSMFVTLNNKIVCWKFCSYTMRKQEHYITVFSKGRRIHQRLAR